MASAITRNSWNCHKFNCALAIHENVPIFAIFYHIIILFQFGLISYYMGEKLKKLDKFTHCSAIIKYSGEQIG